MRAKSRQASLIRDQLTQNLVIFKDFGETRKPVKGWIRSVREALGMSGRQLAARMGVEPSRVTELEKAEAGGNVTLRSLQRAAEALDCRLVYALVPKTDLEETLRRQAYAAAARRLQRVSHTMRLEDQGLSVKDEGRLLEDQAEEFMRELPRWLWDEDVPGI
jgi:predicted DNA-binding mobile mystery protein A